MGCFNLYSTRRQNSLLLLFSLSVSVALLPSGCKNEEDVSVPYIVVTQPFNGQVFNVFDTITVSGIISDVSGITSVNFSLDNALFNPAMIGFSREVNSLQEYSFTIKYPLNDVKLDNGIYYLKVAATNKNGVKREYVELYIKQAERKEKGLIVVMETQTGTSVDFFNTLFERTTMFKLQGKPVFSETDSYNQHLYLATSSPDGLFCYSFTDSAIIWHIYPGVPYSRITALHAADLVYYSTNKGDISGLNTLGVNKFSTIAKPDSIPENLLAFNEFIISENRTPTGDILLLYHYRSTGSFLRKAFPGNDIVHFFQYNDEKVLMFCNGNQGGGIICWYYPFNDGMEILYNSGLMFTSIRQISAEQYLIIGNNKLYFYNAGHEMSGPYLEPLVAGIVEMNSTNENLAMKVSGNKLVFAASLNGPVLYSTYSLAGEIVGLHYLYNY